jgi:hypothetical protein
MLTLVSQPGHMSSSVSKPNCMSALDSKSYCISALVNLPKASQISGQLLKQLLKVNHIFLMNRIEIVKLHFDTVTQIVALTNCYV